MYCFMDSQLPRKERTVCCAEWSIFQRFASYFWSTPGVNIGASPFSHLYIDDISKISLSPGSRLVIYADDILFYHPIFSTSNYHALQADIDSLYRWSILNAITFNTSKCKSMVTSRGKNHCLPLIPLSHNGAILKVVPTFKYRGVLISADMSWSPHIQGICSKARKMLGLLYRQYHFCDSKSLKHMYISLVRPHLEYATQVWDPHLQQNIGDIESVQKFALRICSKEWEKEYTKLLDYF